MYLGFRGYKVIPRACEEQINRYFFNLGYQQKNKVEFLGIQHQTTTTNEWHRDAYLWSKKSYVVVVPLLHPFTKETTTQLVAGSHWFPFLKIRSFIHQPEVPLGSALIFNARILHRRPFFIENRPSTSLLYEKFNFKK